MPHTEEKQAKGQEDLSFEDFKKQVLNDYRLGCMSREASYIGRKEVLTGKAKFGIFGDGKEVPQLAMAKVFQNGDFRSGYYRDQTFMFAAGMTNIEEFFAQLYANPSLEHDPSSAGRQMNAHFSTRSLDENGEWKNLTEMKNSSADTSPTASQMARAVGLALASKQYREVKEIKEWADHVNFSNEGNEVTFCTIGDASTSEGIFWEAINAAGVLKIPMAVFVWDDGYGISVPKKFQTTKGSISELLDGFNPNEDGEGIDIYTVKGWDYAACCELFEKAIEQIRATHRPAVFHVQELTQPQGHSTSGSHERYKSEERLKWEQEFDCLNKMREWLLNSGVSAEEELDAIENEAKKAANEARKAAWKAYSSPIKEEVKEVAALFDEIAKSSRKAEKINEIKAALKNALDPIRRDTMRSVKQVLFVVRDEDIPAKQKLLDWKNNYEKINEERFNTYLHSQSKYAALNVPEVKPQYSDESPLKNGFEILNACFDANLEKYPQLCAFGEDLGKIGDVNQGFAGLQDKYGENRVFDTGIREATIIGQGIGMAMRGLRPIAEIQYLDYLIYGLQPLTDDLATLQYRTRGGQKAPLIIRTRGHRLEGIWHTGSPISMILGSLRGLHVLVPRDMTRAAGFYNTMLQSDDPALIIECLNGYRLKEKLPDNIADFTVPLGVPEVLQEGTDVTLVSYGSTIRVAVDAMQQLEEAGISVELIDVQTLLPFDIHHKITDSLKKTNRIVFLDEDVPGGGTAYMMQKVLEEQKGYYYLDSEPKTISAKAHRSAYASDGDYFSKPNAEDIFKVIYELMHEAQPEKYPLFY